MSPPSISHSKAGRQGFKSIESDVPIHPDRSTIVPKICRFPQPTWPLALAREIMASAAESFKTGVDCSIMLTGGRSAARLYQAWSELPGFGALRNIKFYFSDERCVPPDHMESNYGLAMRTLFRHGVPEKCEVFRIEANQLDYATAALAYERILPSTINIVILSVGEDGHIASLFPHSRALRERKFRVVPVSVSKLPGERITVTPTVLSRAQKTFVMALGPVKEAVFYRALAHPLYIDALPARIVLNATWVFETSGPY